MKEIQSTINTPCVIASPSSLRPGLPDETTWRRRWTYVTCLRRATMNSRNGAENLKCIRNYNHHWLVEVYSGVRNYTPGQCLSPDACTVVAESTQRVQLWLVVISTGERGGVPQGWLSTNNITEHLEQVVTLMTQSCLPPILCLVL